MGPFIGEIRLFPWGWAPDGWAVCDGREFRVIDQQHLFSVIGNTYGGSLGITFKLPDLRERTPLHAGNGPDGTKYLVGLPSGEEKVELSTAQIPPHSHLVHAANGVADNVSPTGHLLATVAGRGESKPSPIYGPAGKEPVLLASDSISTAGESLPHNNMQPFLVMTFCIALKGQPISQ